MTDRVAVLGIIQARASSTRLPGKVLMPILGQPMLARQIERVLRSHTIDRLIVATSTDASDDAVEAVARSAGVDCFRGSLDNVLDRFYRAAEPYAPDHVVRLTGDCPLADPAIVDAVVRAHLEGGFDYTSSAVEPSFPDGLDAEVMTFATLTRAWRDATRLPEREHVTLWMYDEPGRVCVGSYEGDVDRSEMRWTVDEPEDFEFVRTVFERLYPASPNFDSADVLHLLEQDPDLALINSGFRRNEGLEKSLRDEQHDAMSRSEDV